MSDCYAVSVRGKLWPNTVHEHARGAMVNFIFLTGGNVLDNHPDEKIREWFIHAQRTRPELQIRLERVALTRLHTANPERVDLTAVPGMAPAPKEGG